MTQKNREAFEQWAASEGYLVQKITRPHYGEVYRDESTHRAWKGWQACAAHYPPTLTEKEAIVIAHDAAEDACGVRLHPRNTDRIGGKIIAALRAAGVRFKEEA